MKPFSYERAKTPSEAAAAVARQPDANFLAGGTNLLDLMKLKIETPQHLVDVQDLKLDPIESMTDGGLQIGALVTNITPAADTHVRRSYGVLLAPGDAGQSGDADIRHIWHSPAIAERCAGSGSEIWRKGCLPGIELAASNPVK